MHIGRLLCATPDPTTVVMSEWIPRGADNGVFTVELVVAVEARLSVTLFEKNTEDTGPGSSKGAIVSSASAPGLYSATLTGLKELVRLEIEVEGLESGVNGVIYRVLPTTWFNTARVPS